MHNNMSANWYSYRTYLVWYRSGFKSPRWDIRNNNIIALISIFNTDGSVLHFDSHTDNLAITLL